MNPYPLHEDLLASFNDIRSIAEQINSDRHSQVLSESGLSKLWRWINQHECAVISGCRGNPNDLSNCLDQEEIQEALSPKQQANAARSKKLKAMLLAKGYGVTPMLGAYIENMNTPAAKHVHETSYFIVNRKNDADFFDEIIKLGQYFCQDSVILIDVGGNARLYGTNNAEFPGLGQTFELGDFIAGDHAGELEFHSKIKTNRPFAYAMGETIESLTRHDRYACMILAEQLEKEILHENEDRYSRQISRMKKKILLNLLEVVKAGKLKGSVFEDPTFVQNPEYDESDSSLKMTFNASVVGAECINGTAASVSKADTDGDMPEEEKLAEKYGKNLLGYDFYQVEIKISTTDDSDSMTPIVTYSVKGWPSLVFKFNSDAEIIKSLYPICNCYAGILVTVFPDKYLKNAAELYVRERMAIIKQYQEQSRDQRERGSFNEKHRDAMDKAYQKIVDIAEPAYERLYKEMKSCSIGESLRQWNAKMSDGPYPFFDFGDFTRDGNFPSHGTLIKVIG